MNRYTRTGFLAVNPRAFFELHAPTAPVRTVKLCRDAAVVEIQGPLTHHADGPMDSYDAIAARVDEACALNGARFVVLKLDTPGGDVSGMLDTAKDISARCKAAGKRLIAFVDGQACSAGYAFAAACEEIVVPPTGTVGSIGILNVRVDASRLDAAQGLSFYFGTSGSKKAFGNPHLPMSDAEVAEMETHLSTLSALFFGYVSERRGLAVDAIAGLQAGLAYGADAVSARLADRVATFDELLASLAGAVNGEAMAKTYSEARAVLEEVAKGDDEDAKRARAALAAMDKKDEPDAESDDEPKDDEPAAARASSDDEPKDDKAASTSAQLAQMVQTLSAKVTKLETVNVTVERNAFLATRPDLSPELVAVLQTKPLAEVKALVSAIKPPVAPTLETIAATAATVPATAAEGQGSGLGDSTDPELAAVDRAMGFATKQTPKATLQGNTLYLGRAPSAEKV